MKKSLKTFLLFLPAFYLACWSLNHYVFPNFRGVVDLNLSQVPELWASRDVLTSRVEDPQLLKALVRELNKDGQVRERFPQSEETPRVDLQAEMRGTSFLIGFTSSSQIVTTAVLTQFSQLLSEDLRAFVDSERLVAESRQESLLKGLKESIKQAEAEVQELEADAASIASTEPLRRYQELGKTLGPLHPKMEKLLNKVNARRAANDQLSHQAALKIKLKAPIKASVLEAKIEAAKENLSTLKQKLLVDNPPRVQSGPAEIKVSNVRAAPLRLQEQSWVRASYQAFLAAFFLTALIAFNRWRRPTLKTVSIFNDQTGVSSDRIISFPQLKPRRTPLVQRLPLLRGDSERALIPAGKNQIVSVSQQVLTIANPNQRSREMEDQQTLEGMAAELMIKSKYRQNKFFLFSSASAGAGSTTVVANLAVAFSNLSEKVLVIDANFYNSKISEFFGVPSSDVGLSELLLSGEKAAAYIKPSRFSDLDVLPLGNDKGAASKLFSTNAFAQMVKRLSALYNFILIDGGSIIDSAQATLLADQLGGVYLVVNAESTPKEVTKKALARLEKIKVKVDGVILNQAKA